MSGSNNQQVDVDLTSCLAFFECISPHKDSENGEAFLNLARHFLILFVGMHLYPGEEIMIGRDDTWYNSSSEDSTELLTDPVLMSFPTFSSQRDIFVSTLSCTR